MLKWLSNIKMQNKLILLLLIPFLFLLGFGIYWMGDSYQMMKIRENRAKLFEIHKLSDQLIDDLEIEEKLIVAKDDSNNKRDLIEVREKINQSIDLLNARINDPATIIDQNLKAHLNKFIQLLETLENKRISNSKNQITEFSNLLLSLQEQVLLIGSEIGSSAIDNRVLRLLTANEFLMNERYRLEEERLLVETIKANKNTPASDIHDKLISLIAVQDSLRQNFLEIIPKEDRSLYREFIKDNISNELSNIRKNLLDRKNNTESSLDYENVHKFYEERIQQFQNLNANLFKLIEERNSHLINDAKKLLLTLALLLLFALGMTSFLALAILKTITKPLKEASRIADQISQGNLSEKITASSRQDEIGVLERAIEKMVTNLKALTKKLNEEIEVLAASSSEILSSIAEVSSGTAETATAVTETTTTVEELKQTSQVSSEKAKDVLVNSEDALKTLEQSEKSLEITVDGMQNIQRRMSTISESIIKLSEHGQIIGRIIDTVNELAEQSNLLAVNAAIEAAKAGDQGKGFSVVAQEVRRLAEQSKQATVQVHSILSDVQNATSAAVMATEQGSKAVAEGMDQSKQMNESIGSLSTGMSRATQSASQISISSQQQLVGVGQVTVAMTNIREASNQHVEHMRQIEVAVHNLNAVGQSLKTLMESYRL